MNNVYHIIGHSTFNKSKNNLNVHPGQYIIFTSRCGEFSWIDSNREIMKYLKSQNGINRLKREINNGSFKQKFGNIYNIKTEGNKYKNQNVNFINYTSNNKFRKGAYTCPVNLSGLLTNGLNKKSIINYFTNINLNNSSNYYQSDLKSLIGTYPGIFIIDICRGLNGLSFEKNKISHYGTNGKITQIRFPQTRKSRRNEGENSIVTKNLVKCMKQTNLPKKNFGTIALGIRRGYKNAQKLRKKPNNSNSNNNEVTSKRTN